MKCPVMYLISFMLKNVFLDSDDNSSVQSSPWQRDHCWKQTQPRHNISKEMVLFFHRPERLCLSPECQKVAQLKRRRPLDKSGNVKFIKMEKKDMSDGDISSSDDSKSKADEEKLNSDDEKISLEPSQLPERYKEAEKKDKGKLEKILKKLTDRRLSTTVFNGNGSNGHHASQTPTTYSLANHIANSINTQPHQHVSPRKRILRELEKVSLEDTKRSRPKSQTNGNAVATSSISPQLSNGNIKTNPQDKTSAALSVSRPISSYSITSLLAHNNNSITASSASGCNSINDPSNDSSSASHYRDGAQQQRLSLSQNSPSKSPSMMQQKRKSPNTTPPGHQYHSPNQSPSPEHHAFHKYRPITTSTAVPSSSSPYSSSYHSPNYMRGSPSPQGDGYNNRLRTTGSYQHSPSHYASSPSQNYAAPRDSSLSPNVERTTASSRSTPTSSGTSGIRTLPKKTAALRQQFSSPTMESSSKKPVMKSEKAMDVDSLLRPSALVAPPPHPAQMYPYMYPTMGYLPPGVPPYYHPAFYNPAMMAAAAASYRIPGLHPGSITGYPGAAMSPGSAAQMTGSSPPASTYDKNPNGQRNSIMSSSPANHPSLSSYVPTSPWNPIPLTNHSINDGNLIPKAKDEPSSGEKD